MLRALTVISAVSCLAEVKLHRLIDGEALLAGNCVVRQFRELVDTQHHVARLLVQVGVACAPNHVGRQYGAVARISTMCTTASPSIPFCLACVG